MRAKNRDLLDIVDRFSSARVAVLGDLVADEFVYGETDRISREAPVLIVRHERSELKPGAAANAIANLCALGARVRALGLIGDDPIGERLRALLREAGADDRGVLVAEGRPTATKTRVLAGGKNTRRQQMIRIDRDGPGAPAPAVLARVLGALRSAAAQTDALLVSDYGGGLLCPPAIEAVRGLARAGCNVCVDARYGLAHYRGVRLAKPNEVELEQAVGRAIGDDLQALEDAGRELLRTLSAGVLLITRGSSGMALLRPGEPTQLLAAHGGGDAVDVTGAGDTVMSVTTLATAVGAEPVQAMRLANVAGALKVQKAGTAAISADELRAELRTTSVAEPLALPSPRRAARGQR